MDELDDVLRATFRSRQDEATEVAGLAAAVRKGHARRAAKRRQVLTVGAVGVLAVGGSAALALTRHGSPPAPAVSSPATAAATSPAVATTPATTTPAVTTTPAASPLPASGTRAWSSHGLQVRVPAAWKANQLTCGTPTSDTVVIDVGATETCALLSAPAVDVVEFGPATPYDMQPPPATHPTVVGGHQAQTGTEKPPDGRTATLLAVPDLDVSITVKSKDAGLVASIVASAQVVAADANGCPSRLARVEPAGPPVRGGAATVMVPHGALKAIICHYALPSSSNDHPAPDGSTYLASGNEVPQGNLAELTTILDSLKPGLATWQGLAGACTSPEHDGYLLRFSYDFGAPVDVYLHTINCDHMGFDNGAVTGYIAQKFMDDLRKFMPDMGFIATGEAIK